MSRRRHGCCCVTRLPTASRSPKVTMSSFERPNFEWIRLACRTMTHMLHETPQVATKATSSVIRIHAADMSASSVVISPTPDHRSRTVALTISDAAHRLGAWAGPPASSAPKHVNMNARSSFIPSTALSIEPSLPRRALPEPQTETKVVEAVHIRLAQIEMVTKRCKQACARREACAISSVRGRRPPRVSSHLLGVEGVVRQIDLGERGHRKAREHGTLSADRIEAAHK